MFFRCGLPTHPNRLPDVVFQLFRSRKPASEAAVTNLDDGQKEPVDPCVDAIPICEPDLSAPFFASLLESARASYREAAMRIARGRVDSALKKLRPYLEIRQRHPRGRPKGSQKKNTEEAFKLWKDGMTDSEICRALGVPLDEKEKLSARLRSKKRRLPEDERLAVRQAHRDGRRQRVGRKRGASPQTYADVRSPR